MSQDKPSIAAKIAESSKAAVEAKAAQAAQEEELAKAAKDAPGAGGSAAPDSGITVGATAGGMSINNPQKPAGIQNIKRAPGYYSRHCGIIRIKRRNIAWPMEAPLVPKEDDEELIAILDSMVERKLAELVE